MEDTQVEHHLDFTGAGRLDEGFGKVLPSRLHVILDARRRLEGELEAGLEEGGREFGVRLGSEEEFEVGVALRVDEHRLDFGEVRDPQVYVFEEQPVAVLHAGLEFFDREVGLAASQGDLLETGAEFVGRFFDFGGGVRTRARDQQNRTVRGIGFDNAV